MDVVAKVGVGHDEDADVAHGAQVHKLLDLVLHKALIDEGDEDPLHHRWNHQRGNEQGFSLRLHLWWSVFFSLRLHLWWSVLFSLV